MKLEVKEIKVEGFGSKYLNKFFREQKDLKDDWSSVLELVDHECGDTSDSGNANLNSLTSKVKGIVDTYENSKFKNKKANINFLLNKIANSVNSIEREIFNMLTSSKEFCTGIKISLGKIYELLKTYEDN